MITFAIIGVAINGISAFITHKGDSVNQRAVNLHMLEDVFGWIAVLLGAIIMRFTNWSIIDPILSILIAVFIIVGACKNLKSIFDLFLNKVPDKISLKDIKNHILSINEVCDVHHIHIWSNNNNVFATMHVIADNGQIKNIVKEELLKFGITHSTIEIESSKESCNDKTCNYTKHNECFCAHHH
jgi:cobalt-zinc-cadmium efflux system protein